MAGRRSSKMLIRRWKIIRGAKARGEGQYVHALNPFRFYLPWGIVACFFLASCNPCPINDAILDSAWYLERIDVSEEEAYVSFQEKLTQAKLQGQLAPIDSEHIGYIRFFPDQHLVWNIQGLEMAGTWNCKNEMIELKMEGAGEFLSDLYLMETFEHYVLPRGISLENEHIEFVFFSAK